MRPVKRLRESLQEQVNKNQLKETKMRKMILGIIIGGVLGAASGYYLSCTGGVCPLAGNPWRGAISGAVLGFIFSVV